MEGAEEEVPGQAGFDGDAGGFGVADFTDHEHLGILPQQGSQSSREGHSAVGFDLDLGNFVDVPFDRIFEGDDAFAGVFSVDIA